MDIKEMMVLEGKDAAEWTYRGEGAVNLVLAYAGCSPDFVGKVLRVQKAPKNGTGCVNCSAVLTAEERLLWSDIEALISSQTLDVAEHNYVKHLMIPLLGSKHVDPGVHIPVSKAFLESVDRNVLPHRPAWRVDAASVNTLTNSSLLISDHSVFSDDANDVPCISIEIKPKCGFLPHSPYISEENSIKRTKTRFRMHQTLKLHRQEVSEISEYDPLDLFSGIKDRIHKAIKALYSTPQNNFRIFLNGSIIFGGSGAGTKATNSEVAESLEEALCCFIQAEDRNRTQRFLQLVAETVYESEALNRLLEVQKLDSLDIEGAIHAYYNIVSKPCTVCKQIGQDPSSYELHNIRTDESLKIVRDYLIAATAKDCSLIVSFRRKRNAEGISLNVQDFDHKAFFIDLDMKRLDKMEHYYRLDQEIVSSFKTVIQNGIENCQKLQSNGNV